MQSFDPIYLQRLVDGELDREQTRKMLELAESNPVLWREMAGAFVENQLWETGFQKLELGLDPETSKTGPCTKKGYQLPAVNRINWLVLAAGVMIALTAGLLIGQFNKNNNSITGPGPSESSEQQLIASKPPVEVAPMAPRKSAPAHNLVSYQPDYRLELEDANGNPVFDTEVPLYDLATAVRAGYQIDQRPPLPNRLVESVRKRGYWLDQHVNYVSGRLHDGRTFVVPVRTINLVQGQ